MKTILKGLNKFILISYDFLKFIASIVLLVIILVTTTSIFFRYVLNNSLSWAEEICCFLLIYLAFFTAGMATVEKNHITADFVSGIIPDKVKKILSWIIRILELIFFAVIVYATFEIIPVSRQLSSALEIPRKFYYIPVCVMCAYMFIAIVVDMLNDIFPGYDYWRIRQKEIDKKIEEEEAALLAESLKSSDEFMDEQLGGNNT